MKTFLQRNFSGALLWMLVATEVSAQTIAESADSGPTLIFQIVNFAQTPEDVLLEAQQHVQRIYGKAHIRTIWLEGDGAASSPGSNTLQLTIVLVTESMARDLVGDKTVMGFAASTDGLGVRLCICWTCQESSPGTVSYQTQAMRKDSRWTDSGPLIAHEAGHLMLPAGHTPTGIMRGVVDANSLREAVKWNLFFTPDQNKLIRTTLLSQSER